MGSRGTAGKRRAANRDRVTAIRIASAARRRRATDRRRS